METIIKYRFMVRKKHSLRQSQGLENKTRRRFRSSAGGAAQVTANQFLSNVTTIITIGRQSDARCFLKATTRRPLREQSSYRRAAFSKLPSGGDISKRIRQASLANLSCHFRLFER